MKCEWKPIETAPKDGAWILGWSDGDGYVAVEFRDAGGTSRKGWRDSGGMICWPTHWIQLPEPPEATQ